jgi:hypothetical protein
MKTLLDFGVDVARGTQNKEALGTFYVALKSGTPCVTPSTYLRSGNIQAFRILCRHVLKTCPKETVKKLVGNDFVQKAAEHGGLFQGEAQRLLRGEGVVFAGTATQTRSPDAS